MDRGARSYEIMVTVTLARAARGLDDARYASFSDEKKLADECQFRWYQTLCQVSGSAALFVQ